MLAIDLRRIIEQQTAANARLVRKMGELQAQIDRMATCLEALNAAMGNGALLEGVVYPSSDLKNSAGGRKPSAPFRLWTVSRDALVRQQYSRGDIDLLLHRLNQLPGPAVTLTQLWERARQLGYKRRRTGRRGAPPKQLASTSRKSSPIEAAFAEWQVVHHLPAPALRRSRAAIDAWCHKEGLPCDSSDLARVNALRSAYKPALPPFRILEDLDGQERSQPRSEIE